MPHAKSAAAKIQPAKWSDHQQFLAGLSKTAQPEYTSQQGGSIETRATTSSAAPTAAAQNEVLANFFQNLLKKTSQSTPGGGEASREQLEAEIDKLRK